MRNIHVAGVWKSNRLLSVGVNKSRIHGKWIDSYHFPCSIHAEVAALKRLTKENTRGCTLVSVRINTDRQTGNTSLHMAKPCENCTNVINDYGITTVIYSTSE